MVTVVAEGYTTRLKSEVVAETVILKLIFNLLFSGFLWESYKKNYVMMALRTKSFVSELIEGCINTQE